ncbi:MULTISPECIES: lamin tail domain-containing protein [unclassified Lentimicrobium]|uniref:lamin tail domain-containing protein n=1 Tax=unclassified Lentimicrobium TaxID=2677434 RepID=UPI001555E460|nr:MULTISPECIES: lamin tail domain-containing protein [unclassified Lentimicrobium]NPD46178.1 T9SS type A sorting domain-containing protein [Lentimicrobium sp. S6]NPD83229.1 T9SS type A sorting domain-containing protein [Lentimicrobium sp. L6]
MISNLRILISLLLSLSFLGVKAQDLVINEVLASNINGITDSYGEQSDWIEIYNNSSTTINLNSYSLSDKNDNPQKWKFPNVNISSHGYLLVFASENATIGNELHCNFKISQEGEYISLYKPSGVLVDRIDSVELRADVSYGHKLDASGNMKFFGLPTPQTSNTSTAYNGFVSDPIVSHESGFYTDDINVSIVHGGSQVFLRYTLDGSVPTPSSPVYNSEIQFSDATSKPNGISLIKTNPSFDYPKPGFTESRANNRGYLNPYSNINKTNVLKVKAFKDGYLPSETLSSTFFIYSEAEEKYSLPVISLTTDAPNFFDDEMGIYVYGTTGELGNYYESGREWERPTLVQYFENDGTLGFEQYLGARIHGGGGRHSTVKNLRMYARSEYGKDEMKYKFFDNSNINKFKRFMIRGPGHRPDCTPRDDFADLLLQNYNMDVQHVQHVILFVNGEYWGIHSIKERFDQKYLSLKYGKKDDDYVILRDSGKLDSGEEGDEAHYDNLLDFVESNNMEEDENYEYVQTQIDIDNYLSYFSSEVYMGNVDWVITNIKFWRYKGFDKSTKSINGLDGRWRWFMFDFDLVFGGSCDDISSNVNVLDDAFDQEHGKATILARGLKENDQFVIDLVNRTCDHMNSNFNQSNFREKLEEIDQSMTPEMLEHVSRWRYPSIATTLNVRQNEIPTLTQWTNVLDDLYNFPKDRKRKIIDHYTEEFNLEDTIHIALNVNDKNMGNIKINSLFVSEALDGVSESVYPWHGTYFEDIPFQLVAMPKLGYRFVEWQETGDTDASLMVDLDEGAVFTALFEEDPDFVFEDAIFINEFMAVNKSTITDEYNANADWIEIYNPNDKQVDLANFYISDDADDAFKYQFPFGTVSTIIEAYGYKLIWCDDRTERGPLHTNFKLSSSGDDILLMAPDSSLIDNITFGAQGEDIAYGREMDGDETWIYFQKPFGPTPNATNNAAAIDELNQVLLKLYPNPVKSGNRVYFQHQVNIQLHNNLGQLLLLKDNVTYLDTDGLESGVYIISSENFGRTKLLVN